MQIHKFVLYKGSYYPVIHISVKCSDFFHLLKYIYIVSLYARTCFLCYTNINSFKHHKKLKFRCYDYSHFTNKKPERDLGMSSRTYSWLVSAGMEPKFRCLSPRPVLLATMHLLFHFPNPSSR